MKLHVVRQHRWPFVVPTHLVKIAEVSETSTSNESSGSCITATTTRKQSQDGKIEGQGRLEGIIRPIITGAISLDFEGLSITKDELGAVTFVPIL